MLFSPPMPAITIRVLFFDNRLHRMARLMSRTSMSAPTIGSLIVILSKPFEIATACQNPLLLTTLLLSEYRYRGKSEHGKVRS